MTDASVAPRSSWPRSVLGILLVGALAFGIPILAALCAVFANRHFGWPSPHGPILPWLYSHHAFQLALGLVAIAIAKLALPADYGLHLPRQKTYIGAAIFWGLFFGVLMTAVDYAPQLIARTVPKLDYALNAPNVVGWLFFEGVYVGPTEEIPFRSLLVTLLAVLLPARLKLGRFEMRWAGVIVAAMFALLHAGNFMTRDWPLALGQQMYAFALGVLYAYWLEKSGSVVAPVIGHNVGDVTEYALLFGWVAIG